MTHRSILAMAQLTHPSTSNAGSFTMLGAIAGDIVGSVFEGNPTKNVGFAPLFHPQCAATDDTILTVATAHALLTDGDYASAYRSWGKRFPDAGYGASFCRWLGDDGAPGYGSWGNGSAMRSSPVGWAFDSREEVLEEARRSAIVTHGHTEGVKGAQATALAVYLARTLGVTKQDIKEDIECTFGYDLSRKVDDIRPDYNFDVSCQGSVPESIICFLESDSVESAIRLAVSLGGDADTQACIAGGIAEAYYGPLDDRMATEVRQRLPPDVFETVDQFVQRFLSKNDNI